MKIIQKVKKKYDTNKSVYARYLKNGFLLLEIKDSFMLLSTHKFFIRNLSCYNFKNIIQIRCFEEKKYKHNSVWIMESKFYTDIINSFKQLIGN
jgi:hypothetical protein